MILILPPRRRRLAFTLVELLVVITLIAVISGMLSVALTSSQQEAKIRRCRGELLNYGQLIQARYGAVSFQSLQIVTPPAEPRPRQETYDPSRPQEPETIAFNPAGTAITPPTEAGRKRVASEDLARRNLLFRRDFARMVLPQCRADLYLPPATIQWRINPVQPPTSVLAMQAVASKTRVPAVFDQMRELAGLLTHAEVDASTTNSPWSNTLVDGIAEFYSNATFRTLCTTPQISGDRTGDGTAEQWTAENESAECLYLILATFRTLGQSAIDQIPTRNIGDTDGDGMLEILDPWGVAVRFIREPIGLRVPGYASWNPLKPGNAYEYQSDPDPFDFLLSDFRFNPIYTDETFRPLDPKTGTQVSGTLPEAAFEPTFIAPVIVSAGPDGEFGLYCSETIAQSSAASTSPRYFSTSSVVMSSPPTPLYPNVGGSGVLAYRYPDPYFNVKALCDDGTETNAVITPSFPGIVRAKRGGGFGGVISGDDYVPTPDAAEAVADNLYSIDSSL